MKALVLGGLVVFIATFGFAMVYSKQSRPRSTDRRDQGDGGPGVFGSDTGSDCGTSDAADSGGGDGGGGD